MLCAKPVHCNVGLLCAPAIRHRFVLASACRAPQSNYGRIASIRVSCGPNRRPNRFKRVSANTPQPEQAHDVDLPSMHIRHPSPHPWKLILSCTVLGSVLFCLLFCKSRLRQPALRPADVTAVSQFQSQARSTKSGMANSLSQHSFASISFASVLSHAHRAHITQMLIYQAQRVVLISSCMSTCCVWYSDIRCQCHTSVFSRSHVNKIPVMLTS